MISFGKKNFENYFPLNQDCYNLHIWIVALNVRIDSFNALCDCSSTLSECYPHIEFTSVDQNSYTIRTLFNFRNSLPVCTNSKEMCMIAAMLHTSDPHSSTLKTLYISISKFHQKRTDHFHLLYFELLKTMHPIQKSNFTSIEHATSIMQLKACQ